jgi:CPA1 family monovalent cation:H+ antiporter
MASQILIVMIAAIGVMIFAERRNIQAPLMLALVGLAASFIPGLPRLQLEPDIILAVVLPPLLYSAASGLSFISFMRRLGSIVNLGVFLVVVTTFVVGAVAAVVIPGMSAGVAIVLAAVVSPPDAVTATAIGRKLGLPGRLMTVLEGESLINDAAALTLFAFATAAVTGSHLFTSSGVLFFLYNAAAGILVGMLIGGIVHRIRVKLSDASLVTVLSVLVPFTAYLVAEEIGASGVLAVVAAGLSLGHNATRTGYAARIQERQFWRTTDALLEAFVFAYIGLQLRFVIADAAAAGFDIPVLVGLSVLVLLAVILVRIGWVFLTALLFRWRRGVAMRQAMEPRKRARLRRMLRVGDPARREARRRAMREIEPFRWRENLVIAWTGMRGVVTLAAAAGIPFVTAAGVPFPGRNAIQFVAFVVTIGTLLLQGLTLPWLIRILKLGDPAEAEYRRRQHKLADEIGSTATREAATAFRDRQPDPKVRAALGDLLGRFDAGAEGPEDPLRAEYGPLVLELWRSSLEARRAALIRARDEQRLDDEVLREVLEEMDLQQAMMAQWQPGRLREG